MERPNTQLKTLFPNAQWARRWRSPKGDGATTSAVRGPVGYLVNHPAGLAGVQGIGYDYVLGSGGVYVQSQSADLVARVVVAPGELRGLAPVAEKVALPHGLIPARLFEKGMRWFQDDPDTERLFAVRWDGRAYRLVVPAQAGSGFVPRLQAPCLGGRRVPLSRKLFAPSSRPPTTGTSRASASMASSDASTPLGRSCVSGSESTATSLRWTGPRCSAARIRASCSWAKSRSQRETTIK